MEGVVATWGAVGLLLRDQKGSATEGGRGGRGGRQRCSSQDGQLQAETVTLSSAVCVCTRMCVFRRPPPFTL
jgi:hypothetical protein